MSAPYKARYPKGVLIGTVRDCWDGDDQWGTVMMWWFGIADVLWHRSAEPIPADWGYGHSPVCDEVDNNQWPDAQIMTMLDSGEIDPDEMLYVGTVLTRYAGWLKLAGQDY